MHRCYQAENASISVLEKQIMTDLTEHHDELHGLHGGGHRSVPDHIAGTDPRPVLRSVPLARTQYKSAPVQRHDL
eukprot:565153-Rhodomonas_salina.1